jgi:HEAT repeat protein
VRSDADLGVVKTSVAALGRLGLPRDVRLIAPLLARGDEGLRVVAAGSLAMLGDERGLAVVLQATSSADPGVQKSATYALGFFTATAAGERVQAILDDPRAAWRSYALIAQAERRLKVQSSAEQIESLDGLAHGRSRTLAEWAVDRLTDIGNADAADVLRTLRDRPAPVGPMAERRLLAIEARP